jgi:hypothetical protein
LLPHILSRWTSRVAFLGGAVTCVSFIPHIAYLCHPRLFIWHTCQPKSMYFSDFAQPCSHFWTLLHIFPTCGIFPLSGSDEYKNDCSCIFSYRPSMYFQRLPTHVFSAFACTCIFSYCPSMYFQRLPTHVFSALASVCISSDCPFMLF